MDHAVITACLADVHETFLQQRQLAERAAAQLSPEELFRTAAADENSVAALMKHVGGNLRSRWTEPFTTDGEKPDRNRDGEFEVGGDDVATVERIWNDGWHVLDTTLAGFTAADLGRDVVIRGEAIPLMRALQRSLAHTAQHAGQIILLARHWRGPGWRTLSIPRGRSQEYLNRPPS
jgi:hypothetical protein